MSTDIPLHRFPDPTKFPDRFKIWVSLVGGRLETDTNYKSYKNKLVCDIHFITAHKNRFKRLNTLAVPSLQLPGASQARRDACTPSTSRDEPARVTSSKDAADQAPTSSTIPVAGLPTSSELIESPMPVKASSEPGTSYDHMLKQHNYSTLSKMNIKGQRQAKFKTSTADARIFNTEIKTMRSEICRLRKNAKSFKQRLENAKILSKRTSFNKLMRNMNKPSQLFVSMQLQSKKKAKGRRFSQLRNITINSSNIRIKNNINLYSEKRIL